MNCSTCRYELSQCLDGRLPSGRRSVVLEHAASCPTCGTFWDELQNAQKLTLSLRSLEVGSDFREGLWQRIKAGEGTPDAVFHEQVSVVTKLRYTLTGAAAAAALLLGVIYVREQQRGPDGLAPRGDGAVVVADADGAVDRDTPGLRPRGQSRDVGQLAADHNVSFADTPPILSPKPLTFEVLALETARQLEERYAEASLGMRMLRDRGQDDEIAVARVLRSARELRDFGELLLDLHDLERLTFRDARLDADLRFAVQMLAQAPDAGDHAPIAVERFVAPALRKDRLASVADSILVAPARNVREELDDLMRINTTRPEVFPKLFVVLGDPAGLVDEISLMTPGLAFLVEGACGPSWVAPRSEVDRNSLLRMFGQARRETHIQIRIK